jgi:polyisoprenoid-binding protein YceI
MQRAKLSMATAIALVVPMLGVLPGAAGDAPPAPTDTHVAFVATGPAGLSIEGTTSDLKVSSTDASVVVAVPLANLTTGISLRDHHMRDRYLEVPRFPEASLTIARAQLKLPAKGDQPVQADVPASLTLHGQTHNVSVHYEAHNDGPLSVSGRFHLVMTDFGITVPTYLGVTVKPDVDVTASFKLPGGAP